MAGDEYYVSAHDEFLQMGLEGAAMQVLREGLAANPDSIVLRGLLAGAMQEDVPGPPAPLPAEEGAVDMPGAEFWMELRVHGLRPLLRQRGGCVRVLDLFSADVAERALKALEGVEEPHWIESSSQTYASEGSAKHHFYRYDGDGVDEVKHALGLLDGALFPSFQAGRYTGGGMLEAHDDSLYFFIDTHDANRSPRFPAGKMMFRKVAIIYYLSPGWRDDFGGALVDLHHSARPRRLVPCFNSLVAFLVPRMHEVELLAPGCPPRLSVFGWLSEDLPYPPLDSLGPEHSYLDQHAGGA